MKIIFFGTSEFAVPALKKLAADSSYEIVSVVTQPDKPAGRKQALSPSPVKLAAEKLGLKVLQPEKLTIYNLQLTTDLFIVASYGKIIPKAILDIPAHGTLNIHPSLLPKYRGPSPIQAVLLKGDKETGVTIMKLDEEMDHGDIVAKSKYQITNSKIAFTELHDALAEAGAELLIQILPDYLMGKLQLVPQDHNAASYTKIITKEDGRIDWTKSAEEIDRQIRAYSAWPVAWTTLDGKRLKIYEAEVRPLPQTLPPRADSGEGGGPPRRDESRPGRPGEVEINNDVLIVHCKEGLLNVKQLQLEGSKRMTADEFFRGHTGSNGMILE